MTPEQEIERAGRAHEILDNEVFKGAVKEIEDTLIDALKRTPLVDEKLREKICDHIVALDSVLKALRTLVDTGKLAEKQLEPAWRNKVRSIVGI